VHPGWGGQSTNGTYNNGSYPQTPNTNEPADYVQGEDPAKHQGISFVGPWSHGKIVLIDTLNNAMDYAVGQGDTSASGGPATGPQHRLVTLFQPNSGPLGNESGKLLLGYGRATKKMPPGENDNGNLGFQMREGNTAVDFFLNGMIYILPG
jgi:hypothetical protein